MNSWKGHNLPTPELANGCWTSGLAGGPLHQNLGGGAEGSETQLHLALRFCGCSVNSHTLCITSASSLKTTILKRNHATRGGVGGETITSIL